MLPVPARIRLAEEGEILAHPSSSSLGAGAVSLLFFTSFHCLEQEVPLQSGHLGLAGPTVTLSMLSVIPSLSIFESLKSSPTNLWF